MTYEYLCQACGHQWEAEQSISEAPLKKCPRCGKPQAKRQVSGGQGFILKGGGWYADLYGSSTKKSGDDAGSSGASKSSGSDASSTPAATPEAPKPVSDAAAAPKKKSSKKAS